jgi:hypothetical protein
MQVPRKIGELTLKDFLAMGPQKDSALEVRSRLHPHQYVCSIVIYILSLMAITCICPGFYTSKMNGLYSSASL